MLKPKKGFLPLLIATFLLSPAVAWAQESYLDLRIGYNILENGDLEYAGGPLVGEYSDQFSFGGSYGYLDYSGLRFEAELTYRSNDVDAVGGAAVKGRFSSLALMANVLYELDLGGGGYGYHGGAFWPVRPYFGVGVGGVQYSLNAALALGAADVIDDATYALAYQGILGVGMAVTANSQITMDVRYLVSENIEFSEVAGTAFEIDAVQMTGMIGLRTLF